MKEILFIVLSLLSFSGFIVMNIFPNYSLFGWWVCFICGILSLNLLSKLDQKYYEKRKNN